MDLTKKVTKLIQKAQDSGMSLKEIEAEFGMTWGTLLILNGRTKGSVKLGGNGIEGKLTYEFKEASE